MSQVPVPFRDFRVFRCEKPVTQLYRAGYRSSLHVKDLPGKPDIVLPKYHAVVFVHGCFWHRHRNCKMASIPKTHRKFWADKFARNVANDRKHLRQLRRLGWKVLVVWECQLQHPDNVLARLRKTLDPRFPPPVYPVNPI